MTRRQRVCLLTLDFVGPVRNGGIGTAFLALAERLRDAGHDVTVLFPPAFTETEPVTFWREHYRDRGIEFVSLFADGSEKEQALAAYHWLKGRRFDVIHFHEWRAPGYWLTVAKRCGLAFADTTLVCQLHSPSAWHRRHSGRFMESPAEIEVDWLERRSAEGADAVFSPSEYLLRHVEAEGWRLPAHRRVLPNLLPASFPLAEATPNAPRPVTELAFFGRLESRKGVPLFCDAVGRLLPDGPLPERVSFLGKVGEVAGRNALSHIADAAAGWPFDWAVLNHLDVEGARGFLSAPGRLAVIASESENSPYAVLECLASGVPFLAPDVGGIAELVAEDDRAQVLYERSPAGLAAALRRVLAEGLMPARPRVPMAEAQRDWLAWQDGLAPSAPRAAPAPARAEPPPLVSVCVGTFNRPETLGTAIASLEAQTYPNLEVVLVDDCSTRPEAQAFLEALQPRFEARGWRVLRNETNSWQGVTRARAVAASRGEYLLFMDDDNVAWPDEVATFVRAAEHSGADVLTCQQQSFEGGGEPPSARAARPAGWVPVGPCPALGLFENAFGDANMFMRRTAWDRMGGFTRDRAYFEDWEFLQAATLAGLRVECLPEILFCYRIWGGAQTAAPDQVFLHRSYARTLRPVLAAVPAALRPAVEFAFESHLAAMQRRREGYWSRGAQAGPLDEAINGHPPNSAAAFAAAAGAALRSGKTGAARALAEQALRLSPGHAPAKELLDSLG